MAEVEKFIEIDRISETNSVENEIVNDSPEVELTDTIIVDVTLNNEKNKSAKKEKFINPFDAGVTYNEFQKALGKKSVAEYCKGKLTNDQIDWLENELSILNNK